MTEKINLICNWYMPCLEGTWGCTKHWTSSFYISRDRNLKFLLPNDQLTQTSEQVNY